MSDVVDPIITGLTHVPIKLTKNEKYIRNGTKSYVHLMNKYKFNPTIEAESSKYFQGPFLSQQGKFGAGVGGRASIVQRLKKKTGPGEQDIGLVGADDMQNDAFYLAEVGIGTPAVPFKLNFDTSSSDLWVWSIHLNKVTLQNAGTRAVYDPSNSSTYKNVDGSTWNITYGDGSSASGTVGKDAVTLGGLTIHEQSIELANNLSSSFQESEGSGLLGLAFGNINTVSPEPVATPVDNLIAQNDIPASAELFTCKLGSWRDKTDEPDHGESFYTFGYIHQPTVDAGGGKIYWTKIDSSGGWWQYKSSSVTVNGKSFKRAKNNTAIADTGTTLALIDDNSCNAIYKQIPGAKYSPDLMGFVFPANVTEAQLPVVEFDVNGKSFAVQKEDLGFADAGNGYIYGGIQSRGDMPLDILGDTFLKGQYAIFDVGNKRLGLVSRPEQKQNLSASPFENTAGASTAQNNEATQKSFFARLIGKNKTVEKQAEL